MSPAPLTRLRSLAALIAAMLLASGCTSLSADGGFGAVTELTQDRLGAQPRMVRGSDDARALDQSLKAILAKPISAADAVQVAILNNPGLQASYWSVGIAETELVEAGRLQNPSFSFERTHAGANVEIERAFTFNVIGLLTAPLAKRIEGRRFEQTKLAVTHDILLHAAETRTAYYEAVAAVQGLAYARQVSSSADASAELAERMVKAGNWSQLDLAREQAFYAEAVAEVGRASKTAIATREKLTRLMGLWGENAAYTLPDRLPELPEAPLDLADIEQTAMRERLDIQAAKLEAAGTAAALGLSKATRFINVLELGYLRNSASGEPSAKGYEISLELPLFNWGSSRVARAEAIYMQSVNKVAQAAIAGRSEARESYLDYRGAYDLAKHYREQIIPLRKKISDETLLRYNGMLISVFELLTDARESAAAVNGYITAMKDYWVAQARLEMALGGRLQQVPHDTKKESTQ